MGFIRVFSVKQTPLAESAKGLNSSYGPLAGEGLTHQGSTM